MQEIKKEDVIFLSDNGKIFLSEDECLKEEIKIEKTKKTIKIILFSGFIVIGFLMLDTYNFVQNINNQISGNF